MTYPQTPLALETLRELREAIARKGDFPAISGAVQQIVRAMRDDAPSGFDLTEAVLSDFALTQRVIRLANSAMYAAFGGDISTVSRAVYVLGTETVGHLVLGLKVIDGLDHAAGEGTARTELVKAMVASAIARKVAETASTKDSEESAVCTLLHNLGRLLVAFYLPAQWESIRLKILAEGLLESPAALAVLGTEIHALGREMAAYWGLPGTLTNVMRPAVPAGEHPLNHADWLASLANFSTQCSTLVAEKSGSADAAMQQLACSYAASLGLEPSVLSAAAVAAGEGPECQQLIASNRKTKEGSDSEKPLDAYSRLNRGLQDMEALAETADLPTLSGLLLEAMHTSMGFRRVFVFLRNGNTHKVGARMALGEGARGLMPRLNFDEAFEPDIFHFSMAQNRPVFVEDVDDSARRAKLPQWFKENLGSTRSFLCVPLVVGASPVGLLYGDWETKNTRLTVVGHELVIILKMRDILVRALARQKGQNSRPDGPLPIVSRDNSAHQTETAV